MRLGGAYWVQPQTEVFGSFAYETSPVANKDQDPLLFDSTRLYGTLGVRYAFTPHLFGALAYTYVYFLPVTVTDSALGSYRAAVELAERERQLHAGAVRLRRRHELRLLGWGSPEDPGGLYAGP